MLNLDTHIILFAINQTLTPREKAAIESSPCGFSQIVLWEIAKLHSIGRIDVSLSDRHFTDMLSQFTQWPVSIEVCPAMEFLDFRSDPADEVIAATSLAYNIPLLTRDRKLLASKVLPLVR